MSGKYIIIEGIDGSGKTTMSERLEMWLADQDVPSRYTRHPGATSFGGEIRRLTKEYDLDPITEALLFAVDNSAFTHQILRPNLADGTWIIADRSNFISSLAYQIASGCSIDDLDRVHDAIPSPPKADLLIILRANPDVVKSRVMGRGGVGKDRFEQKMNEDRTYFSKVAKAYDMMLDEPNKEFQHRLSKFVNLTTTTPHPVPRCLGIDANRSEDEVFASIVETVKPLLSPVSV